MKKILFILIMIQLSIPLLADSTFVSGTIINETWTSANSPYCVTGDIFIAGLTIEPGVKISFLGNYVFKVGGVLTAIGTEQDSIYFTKVDSIIGWQGVFFDQSNPGSMLRYCVIEGSQNGGIRINDSYPQIKNCFIRNNSSSRGGGIDAINITSLNLEYCKIVNNSVTGYNTQGGGLYVDNGDVILTNCIFLDNSVSVSGNNSVSKGGGIYVNGNLTMSKCTVANNYISSYVSANYWTTASYSQGSGISVVGEVILTNCKIIDNVARAEAYAPGPGAGYALSQGGGIFANVSSMDIRNTIVAYNSVLAYSDGSVLREGGGVYLSAGIANITNSTIAYNNYSGFFNISDPTIVMNSIFWENSSNQIWGNAVVTYSNVQNGYPGVGNIDVNPLFYNTPDSLKIVQGSLCIDAGNPDSIYNDPEDPTNPGFALWPALGTIRNDMGAHGGPGAYGWVPNAMPVLANPILDQSFEEDSGPKTVVVDLNTVFTDPNPGDLLSFAVISNNPEIQMSIQNDSLILNSSLNYFGEGNVVVTATDQGALSVSDTFSVIITPVNDLPIIQLPDSIQFYNDSSAVLNIWDYVEDVETSDSLLNYEFNTSNDSLFWNYASLTGEITLTAPGFIGTCFFYVTVTDDSSANALDSMQVVVDELTSVFSYNDQLPSEYILFQNYPNPFKQYCSMNVSRLAIIPLSLMGITLAVDYIFIGLIRIGFIK
jgi:predicted outer membrane repeat protein